MGAFNKVEETHPTVVPRWPTRVFASKCVQKIMNVCEQERAHFDLSLARQLKRDSGRGKSLLLFDYFDEKIAHFLSLQVTIL